ncbi:MAG: hypothetical protein MAG581_00367 [Deltaproteobacteria bacterium]|jgi:hypothetical protein|nr:hypothetical protein [Deltaproteobacteria bacterium]
MKNILFFIISIFFSVQVLAQTGDSQEVVPTDQTAKTNLAGEYIYADSYFKKSKTGVTVKYGMPAAGTTIFYGWRFVVYNTEKFFVGGQGYTGQLGGPTDVGTYTYGGMLAGYDFTIFDDIYVEWGLQAGGGGAKMSGSQTISTGGVILEPWFGFNSKIGENTDFNYSFSYFLTPNDLYLPGLNFNLRVDFIID